MSEHYFMGTATRLSTTVPAIVVVRFCQRSYESGFPYVTTEFATAADGEWARGREWDRRRPDEMEAMGYKPTASHSLPAPKDVAKAMGLDYEAAMSALRDAEKREAARVAAWKAEQAVRVAANA